MVKIVLVVLFAVISMSLGNPTDQSQQEGTMEDLSHEMVIPMERIKPNGPLSNLLNIFRTSTSTQASTTASGPITTLRPICHYLCANAPTPCTPTTTLPAGTTCIPANDPHCGGCP